MIRKIVILSLLIALAIGVHYVEGMISAPLPIPGYHLGLANAVSLFALFFFGPIEYFIVSLFRILIVAFAFSGFGPSFFLSLGGFLASAVVTFIFYYLLKGSVYSISIGGAFFHSVGQLLAFALLFDTFSIFYYLLFLGPLSMVAGLVIAILVKVVCKNLPKSIYNDNYRKRR